MTSPDDHRQFRVTRADDGQPVVLLDGIDITRQLVAYDLREQYGDLPVVVLHLSKRATMDATFDGLARVTVGHDPDPGPAAAEFLDAIDPDTLESAALSRVDLGEGPGALTAAMLRQLSEWANGRP